MRFRVDESYATLEAAPCLDAGFLGAGWYEEQTAWEVSKEIQMASLVSFVFELLVML